MDINCTDSCKYQHEGKCKLETIPSFTQGISKDSTCPYYALTEK